jgi:hypothetical protein
MSIYVDLQVFPLTKPFSAPKWAFKGFMSQMAFHMSVESGPAFQDFIATFKGAWECFIWFSSVPGF